MLVFYTADHSVIIKIAVHTNLNPNSSQLFITEYVHLNKWFYAWKNVLHSCFNMLAGGAFDRLNWQHSGEFDQNFSKSQMPRGGGGGMGGFGIDRYIN